MEAENDLGTNARAGRVRAGAKKVAPPVPLAKVLEHLACDMTELVRQEVALAKAEVRDMAVAVTRDGAKVAAAAALIVTGLLSFVAFLIVGGGSLLDGRYWLSALIVAVVCAGGGAGLGRYALADMRRRGVVPRETVATLRDAADWVKQETTTALKRDLMR